MARIEINSYSESMGIWMIFAFSILYMSFGIYQFLLGYFTKKSKRFEKKRAEKLEELDRAIEHYRILIEHSNDIIYRTDLKGILTYVNPAAVQTMGYTEEELLGKHSLELVRPDYQKDAELFYTNLLLAKTDENSIELPVITKNGDEIWLEQKVQLLKNEDEVTAIQAIASDVTERRKAEQQLKSNEELFQQFVKYTPAAVAMFDKEMRYLAVSDRWLEDFGLEDEVVIGRSYYELFPEIPEEWVEIHRSCLTGVSYKCEEEPFPRKDGTVDWLQWEVHPWYELPGKVGGLIMFKELITGRKEAEETLLKRKEMAEEASRMKT
ncbi:MAG: PAS domain S-box protein, partial [Balneolaceae bacterium]|nr:PAS domain S-box protein [Balneolaceae bacterium]